MIIMPDPVAFAELDALLLDDLGYCQVVGAMALLRFPSVQLMAWANLHQIYQYPTTELVDCLREEIDGRVAVEICAGRGPIGRALGIPQTDSYLDAPELRQLLAEVGRELLPPRDGVVKADALAAVEMFGPRVVVGAWVTELGGPERRSTSPHGVDEIALTRGIQRYILIGNRKTHGYRRLMYRRHRTIKAPWLISRSQHPDQNRIWIWG